MTWQGKRRAQLPRNWAAIRKQRLELDGYRCTAVVDSGWVNEPTRSGAAPRTPHRCPAQATDVHHALDPNDHRIEALASLCTWHHQQETQAEAVAARAKKSQKRAKQPHPGLR